LPTEELSLSPSATETIERVADEPTGAFDVEILSAQAREAVATSYTAAFRRAMVVSAGMAAAGGVVATLTIQNEASGERGQGGQEACLVGRPGTTKPGGPGTTEVRRSMSLQFRGPGRIPLTLQVNGRVVQVQVEPWRTLLSVLREELGLTGAKEGCGEGNCGACTVIIDDETRYACLTLAVECEGRQIRTIEGLSRGGKLHQVQEAFVQEDGYQCGFCTSGQIMSAVALLEGKPNPTEEEVRRGMVGNLCRCGAYPNIVGAVLAAAGRQEGEDAED
jgi:aerobic-type carbon monoxide dehydrogenase small subunit (CoxS/CutS family)